jgi:hypothetical protein
LHANTVLLVMYVENDVSDSGEVTERAQQPRRRALFHADDSGAPVNIPELLIRRVHGITSPSRTADRVAERQLTTYRLRRQSARGGDRSPA